MRGLAGSRRGRDGLFPCSFSSGEASPHLYAGGDVADVTYRPSNNRLYGFANSRRVAGPAIHALPRVKTRKEVVFCRLCNSLSEQSCHLVDVRRQLRGVEHDSRASRELYSVA